MCIGTPVQVITPLPWRAVCRDRDGSDCLVDTCLLDEVQAGDWLLMQAGSACRQLDEQQAMEILAALNTLERAAQGLACDLQQGFADLLAREPQLPEHLRKC